jgi:hypothetical protein
MIQAPAFRVVHHVVCRHRVEVAVQPPQAALYFHDERWIDPIDTQLRFAAVVYNSDRGVTWQVLAPDGGPGRGTIDATGLYQAPDKGALDSGTTDVVVATAHADPLRKAFAWITLVGLGPLPAPAPRIEIWPKQVTLFYPDSHDYAYLDDRNKRQVFRAFPGHAPNPRVQWLVNGAPQFPPAGTDPWFTYSAPADASSYPANGPSYQEVTVVAQLAADPGVQDAAKVTLIDYAWPGF